MKKNLLTIILSLAFVVIWGIIIYRIVIYFTSLNDKDIGPAPDNSTMVVNSSPNKPATGNYKISRDPFEMHSLAKEIKNPEGKPLVPKKFTNFKVNGVILSKNGFLVTIENLEDKSVHFLREKESYNEIKIIKVKDKTIQMLIYDELKEIGF
jgi:hypothetical protein